MGTIVDTSKFSIILRRKIVLSAEMEDVFDENGHSTVDEVSYRRMGEGIVKDAFRDGVSVGMERYLQKGFNDGFCAVINVSMELAKLRGCLTALIGKDISKEKRDITEELMSECEDLLERVSCAEEDWVKCSWEAQLKCSELIQDNGKKDTISKNSECCRREKDGCCSETADIPDKLESSQTHLLLTKPTQSTPKIQELLDSRSPVAVSETYPQVSDISLKINDFKKEFQSILINLEKQN